ncbi:MAG TPA: hypothetical protein DCE47_02045, partial [Planctomycetaceae bacterium]|nr:hypothetical protein [Planctomycetaceae bacterium]
NNSVKDNGTGGIDINPSGPQTTAIKSSEISENFGIGIDVSAGPRVVVTIRDNLIRNNIDSDLTDAVLTGDAIELTTPGLSAGPLHATITGNFIEGNDGRGIDLLNTGTMQVKIGDPILPLDSGRNDIVGNRLEGLYLVNTADTNQSQSVPSTDPLLEGGQVGAAGNVMLHVDTNTIEDNGVGSSLAGTGLIMRAGTVFGGGTYTTRDASGDLTRVGGEGASNATGVGSNDGSLGKGNGRINARIANNTFEGNFGNDFFVEAFRSTVDPPATSGTWTTDDFSVSSYSSDPLSRVNLVFTGNTGNGLQAAVAGNPTYSNAEGDFKRRETGKSPAGPFSSGTLPRSACLIPWRAPGVGPNEAVIAPEFQYPGVGPERTWRVLTGFDTSGSGPFDAFDLGSNFNDPGICGWDIMGPLASGGTGWGGTTLDSFVSEKTTKVTVVDPEVFVGGGGDPPMSGLADGFTFQVGLEEMRAFRDPADPTGATFDVDRGWRNTPISSHAAGTSVGLFTFGDPVTATFPLPDIVDVTPTIRNSDAGVVDITFSEDMRNVAIDDLALAFDDGNKAGLAGGNWTTGVITGASHIRPDGTKNPVTIESIAVGGVPDPNNPLQLINPRLSEGDEVTISGILGNGAANGVYSVSNIQANSFDLGIDEVQLLELTGSPTGGTFTLTFQQETNEIQRIDMSGHILDGHFAIGFRPPVGATEFTNPLEYSATAADVQAALEGAEIPTLTAGDVIVTGGPLAGINEVQEVEITGAAFGGDVVKLTYLHPVTILPGNIDDTTTTIEVYESGEFLDPYGNPLSVPFLIRIDDEQMRVTAVVGDELTVDRAVDGTVAASHRRRARVREVQTTIPILTGTPIWGAHNEVQRLAITGAAEGDTFTLSFLHPDTQPGVVAGQFNAQLSTVEFDVEDYAAMTDAFGMPLNTGVLSEADQYNIRVEDEEMRVTEVDVSVVGGPHTLTVIRAINGTDPEIHNSDTEAFYIETTEPIEYNAPSDDSRNDIQRITMLGDPDGGFFTLTFQHPESVPTTLDGSVDDVTTTLTVDDVSEMTDGFGGSLLAVGEFNIRVDDELMLVTAVDAGGNTLEVVRGINGTTPAVHLDQAEIFEVQTTRRIAFDAPADDSINETQQIALVGGPDGGTFTLSFLHPEATPAILFGTNEIQEVSLSGSPTGGTFTLTFEHPTNSNQDSVATTMLVGDLTVSVNDASVFGNPTPFPARIDSELVSVTNVDTTNNILTVIRAQLGTAAAQHEIGALVTEVETTAAIDFDADAADVVTALDGLATLVAADIAISGGDLPGTPIVVQFVGALANTPIQELVADGTNLTGGTAPDADVTTTQDGISGLGVGATTLLLEDVSQMTDGQGNPIPVGTPLDPADQFNIRIDDEEMLVTAVDDVANTFTVTRAINGTTEVVHLIDADVHFIETTAAIDF